MTINANGDEWTELSLVYITNKKARYYMRIVDKLQDYRNDGIVIGKSDDGKYYVDDGYQNVLLLAPTGYGKGVGFVIPNLLLSDDSMIVHDIKMENYVLSSGWRASQGHSIFVWEPLNPKRMTCRYNPLDWISLNDDQMITDIEKIALLLIPECPHRTHLCRPLRSLLTACILYLIAHDERPRTFGEIVRILMHDISDLFTKCVNGHHDHLHPLGKNLISYFVSMEHDKFAELVLKLLSRLELWQNPLIDYATSKSDFDIADFKTRKKTLYVGLQPKDVILLKPLMNFFYSHVLDRLAHYPEDSAASHGTILCLDEFAGIGKISGMLQLLPYSRGYRTKLLLIAENLSQIKNVYGEDGMNIITSNTATKISYGTNDYHTAETIAKLASSLSSNDVSANDVINLDSQKEIILQDRSDATVCQRLVYHKDATLSDRIMEPHLPSQITE
jgi:type IV secretion system protein VirD4